MVEIWAELAPPNHQQPWWIADIMMQSGDNIWRYDTVVDTEKEQSEDKGHNKNHDGCDHCLTAGWPNNLRDLGANLLGKLQWIYHSHPRILFKATLVRIAVCVA